MRDSGVILLSDFSEVLFHGIQGTENFIAKRYGSKAGRQFKTRMESAEMQEWLRELLRGKLDEDLFWEDFIRDCEDLPFSAEDAKQAFRDNMRRPGIDGTFELYKSIKKVAKYIGSDEKVEGAPEMWIISDHIKECIPDLNVYHQEVFEYAKAMIWSCDFGIIKQDPEFFGVLISKFDFDPSELIFVDDNLKNVEAAREYGIYAIVFENAKQLESDLKKAGFEFV